MSERLADVGRRIGTVRQLGAVVNAMRGIAGSRAQQARALLPAIRAYADVAGRAIAQAQRLVTDRGPQRPGSQGGRPGLIVFGAEQGFAGAFAEQALGAAAGDFPGAHVFLVGSRAATLAAERRLDAAWQIGLPARAAAITETAAAIVEAVYAHLAEAGAVPVAMIYPVWTPGHGAVVRHRSLLPFVPGALPAGSGDPPLINLPAAELVERLAQEYVFATVCEAAAEAFAAENEARMATMAAAKTNIDGKLAALRLEERITRQEEITAEVVELAAGARSRRPA